jgi:signal peptidase II
VIDSTFYGLLFNESIGENAVFMPEEGGYAPLFFGKVVDMLYFPLFEGFLPSWIPIWGGDYFIFFRPVFNIADSAITIGVLTLAIFFRDHFRENTNEAAPEGHNP